MRETIMTVVGNLVDEPRMRLTGGGHAVTNFRIASTPRRFDRDKQQYVDDSTLFVNVSCWRAMAENAAASLHKGQPVIVTGRFYARQYTVNEVVRVAHELDAHAVGHDLSRGTSAFTKVFRNRGPEVEVDAEGVPVDRSDEWHGLTPAAENDTELVSEPSEAVPAA